MGHWEICRVCTKCTKSDQLKNLFEKSSSKLIKKIEEITGILLKDLEQFPQHMCNACEDDLEKAYEFRERCIFAQEYFTTVEYREQTYLPKEDDGNAKCANTSTMKDELQPIEENFIEDICFLKEEPCEFQCQLEPVEPLEENQEDAEDTLAGTDKPHQPTEVEKQDNFEPELQTKSNSETEKQKSKRKAGQNVRQHVDKPIVRTRKRKISDSKRSYICDQCGNSFTCRHRFKTHLRRHTGDKRFNCEVCPDKFFTHSELTRHMRKHTGEKPFECKHCGRRFSDYSTRIKHERTHTNERPFVCTQCTKAFTTSYILKNHMLVHTGERSFKCDLCSKAFQRQIHLDVHCRSLTHRQNEEKQKQKMFIT